MEQEISSKKVLVLGSSGMIGHVVKKHLESCSHYKVIGASRKPQEGDLPFDVTNLNSLQQVLIAVNPDVIINATGILINEAKHNFTNAIYVNSYFPHYLADLCQETKAKIVMFSTDCVFSGAKGRYAEDDFKDGKDNYARSKALGDVVNEKDLTIRTSVIGPELKTPGLGLLSWFLRQENSIKGYAKAYWSGITTLELAKVVDACLQQDITGLYHIVSNEKISKYNLLSLIKDTWHRDNVDIIKDDSYLSDKSLVCNRDELAYKMPNYATMLKELKGWIERSDTSSDETK